MAALEVLLFGGFQLLSDGEPLPPIPSRAARSLLAYLVLDRGVRHSRDRLAGEFWPDLPPARARRRLSHTLWQVQDALGELPGDWNHLQATTDAISIAPDAPCWIDVEEFERRLDGVRSAGRAAPRATADRAALEEAVELYRGDFLAGHYDEWAQTEQQRLGQRYLDALSDLIGLTRTAGNYADALVYARRLTNHDPLREDAHREVMRLCTLLGRPSDALRQYERCREVLAEELDAEPAAATQQLYLRIQQERHRSVADPASIAAEQARFPARLPLTGRDRERADAVAVLEDALAGRGGLVLVEADPGHGKSRLLAELVDDGLWRGFRVLRAVCRGPDVAGPYAAVRQLLEPALTPLRVEQLRHRIEPVWLGVVAQLLPAIAQALPPEQRPVPAVRSDEAAPRLRHALVRTFTALAGLDPLLLVIDDLQWVDDPSLHVLADLAAESPEHGLALLLGYRGEEARVRPVVWDAVRDLDRRVRPTRIVLGPLTVEAVADLVRAAGGPRGTEVALADRLHRETGGNPLFVVETLRTLSDADERGRLLLTGVDVGALPLPATIRDLVIDRLQVLSTEERNVVDLAAVGGDGSDLDTLVAASDLPRATVADALAVLVERALLAERGAGFGLHHDQIRRVVLEAMPAGASRALHRRFGEALEQHHPAAVDRLAHHFLTAGDSRKAVHYLRDAARAATAVHAYAAAEDYLRKAVEEQHRRPASVSARFSLLADHADVLDVLGNREQQRRAVDELMTLAAGSAGREVDALHRQALLAAHLGDHAAARSSASQAVATASTLGDDQLLARARFALARVLVWAGERRAAAPLFVRALRTPGLPPGVVIEIRTTLASALRELQRYRAASLELDAALSVARAHEELREEAHALGVLGTVRMETGYAAEATDLYGQAIDRCHAIGFRRGEGINLVNRGNVHYVRGHLAAALADYEHAAATFAEIDDRRGEAVVRLNLGVVAHRVLGDDTRAFAELMAALDFFSQAGDVAFEGAVREALAGVELRAGNADEAQRHVAAAFALPGLSDDVRGYVQLLLRAAGLELGEGRSEESAARLREAEELVDRHDLTDLAPEVRALRGRWHLDAGELDAAVAATSAGVDALDEGIERAWLVRLAHHDALLAAGRPDEADTVAAEAADELVALLAGLAPDDRERAEAVPEHRRILDAADRVRPRRVSVVVASSSAPRGRPLHAAEFVEVELVLVPGPEAPEDPIERRRWLLARVADDISTQGGAATTADLARLLDVSEATVRRDLQALRASGRPIETRGSRAG